MDEARYMAVVNAANREKDVSWMRAHLLGDVVMTDVSDAWAQLALQGPKSKELLLGFLPEEALPKKYYHFVPEVEIAGVKCMLSRTGYTGEWGYELYCRPEDAETLFRALLKAGACLLYTSRGRRAGRKKSPRQGRRSPGSPDIAPGSCGSPARNFFAAPSYYHSISSTGTTLSLMRLEATMPFLISTMRSAMAVIA